MRFPVRAELVEARKPLFQQALKSLRSPPVISVLIGILISLGIIGLRSFGILESVELAAYDLCIRLRPDVSGPDPRIVLISVTEDDIRKQGHWPLTDDTLAQALEILSQSQPRAIGVDIYRDIPVPPGHDRLNAILTKNRRIIATTKFADDPASVVPPPPVLKNTDQVGFNYIPIDPDGIVRRGLLMMDDGRNNSLFFFFAPGAAVLAGGRNYAPTRSVQPRISAPR